MGAALEMADFELFDEGDPELGVVGGKEGGSGESENTCAYDN